MKPESERERLPGPLPPAPPAGGLRLELGSGWTRSCSGFSRLFLAGPASSTAGFQAGGLLSELSRGFSVVFTGIIILFSQSSSVGINFHHVHNYSQVNWKKQFKRKTTGTNKKAPASAEETLRPACGGHPARAPGTRAGAREAPGRRSGAREEEAV